MAHLTRRNDYKLFSDSHEAYVSDRDLCTCDKLKMTRRYIAIATIFLHQPQSKCGMSSSNIILNFKVLNHCRALGAARLDSTFERFRPAVIRVKSDNDL